MSVMDCDIFPMASAPSLTISLASLMRVLAWLAFSAFCLIWELISSSDAEVSSRLEACSLAPSAICWLDWATWREAEVTCSAPEVSEVTAAFSGLLTERAIARASRATTRPTAARPPRTHMTSWLLALALVDSISDLAAMATPSSISQTNAQCSP